MYPKITAGEHENECKFNAPQVFETGIKE